PLLSSVSLFCNAQPAAIAAHDGLAATIQTGDWVKLEHEPSVRLAPDYYRAVSEALRRSEGPSWTEGRLRVLVVSPLAGGSYSIAQFARRGLEKAGCDAELLDLGPFHSSMNHLRESLRLTTVQRRMEEQFERLLCEFVYWRIRQLEPELVLFLA